MNDYTPSTEEIKESWCEPRTSAQGINPDYHYSMAEAFDRWLASVQADAWERGAKDMLYSITGISETAPHNPYRENQ